MKSYSSCFTNVKDVTPSDTWRSQTYTAPYSIHWVNCAQALQRPKRPKLLCTQTQQQTDGKEEKKLDDWTNLEEAFHSSGKWTEISNKPVVHLKKSKGCDSCDKEKKSKNLKCNWRYKPEITVDTETDTIFPCQRIFINQWDHIILTPKLAPRVSKLWARHRSNQRSVPIYWAGCAPLGRISN